MKKIVSTLALGILLVVAGCAHPQYFQISQNTYPPTQKEIQILWSQPNKPYEEIGTLLWDRTGWAEWEILKMFKEKAKEVGGDAVMIQSSNTSGGGVGATGFVNPGMSVGNVSMPGSFDFNIYNTPPRRTMRGLVMKFKDSSSTDILKPDTKPQVSPTEKLQVTPSRESTTSTSAIPSSGTATIVTVIWTFANLRSGAGNNYPVVTAVKQGDKLTVIGEYGDWFNVRLGNGQEGWISNRVVK